MLKDPNRVADSSTIRRWSDGLDRLQPAASFRVQTFARLAHWLGRDAPAERQPETLARLTPVLQVLWPLRL